MCSHLLSNAYCQLYIASPSRLLIYISGDLTLDTLAPFSDCYRGATLTVSAATQLDSREIAPCNEWA